MGSVGHTILLNGISGSPHSTLWDLWGAQYALLMTVMGDNMQLVKANCGAACTVFSTLWSLSFVCLFLTGELCHKVLSSFPESG